MPAVLLGLCIAKVNLIAAWAALAPGNILVRVSWSLLLGMAMWYALVLGCATEHRHDLSDAVLLGTILLAGVAILQIPLWIAKKRFRWRLTGGAEDASQFLLEDRQFNLQHMLLVMFLWAVALSPLHTVLPNGNVNSLHLDADLLVILPAVVVCDLLVTIPCIWWAFVPTARLLPLLLGWLLYCAALSALETAILVAILPPWGEDQVVIGGVIFVINVTECVAVFGVLRIFRAMGFRLVRFPKTDPRAAGRPAGPLPG